MIVTQLVTLRRAPVVWTIPEYSRPAAAGFVLLFRYGAEAAAAQSNGHKNPDRLDRVLNCPHVRGYR
ncbi:hypothetical protein [Actinoplanes sp. NPDC049681]|uniref:hypothetical protein n=1 Tax=Actinoplanes sp. NPDC049681 TaxID=3363905 RepID=UPI0037A7A0F7